MIYLPEFELLEVPPMITVHSVTRVIMQHIKHETNEREPMFYNFGMEVGRESTCKELLQSVEYLLADELARDSRLDVAATVSTRSSLVSTSSPRHRSRPHLASRPGGVSFCI